MRDSTDLLVVGLAVSLTVVVWVVLLQMPKHKEGHGPGKSKLPNWLWGLVGLGSLLICWVLVGYVLLIRHLPSLLPWWARAPFHMLYWAVLLCFLSACVGATCGDDTKLERVAFRAMELCLLLFVAGGVMLVLVRVIVAWKSAG